MSKQTAAASNQTCSCQYPGDMCPACYGKRRITLQNRLWTATLEAARVQQEMLELEAGLRDHLRSRNQEELET